MVPIEFFIEDAVMLLAALGTVAMAWPQRRGAIVPRWQLLVPGLLAFFSTLMLLGYPQFRDLLDLEVWSVAIAGIVAGCLRGALLGMDSDHAYRLVRLTGSADGRWIAMALLLVASVQAAVEIHTLAENPWEPTVELLMLLMGGYLLGRSVIGRIRTGQLQHVVLRD
jgi:hypothetical protein